MAGMQLLLKIEHSCEAYVRGSLWRFARLTACPLHPKGGCGLARHGTYKRYTQFGEARILRYLCPKANVTFSLLPQFFAAQMSGELHEVELQIDAYESQGMRAAASQVHPSEVIDPLDAERWLRHRVKQVYASLTMIVGMLSNLLAGCPVRVHSMRQALGVEDLLVPLRLRVEDHLQVLPHPLGFHPLRRRAPNSSVGTPHSGDSDDLKRIDHRVAHRHWQVLFNKHGD